MRDDDDSPALTPITDDLPDAHGHAALLLVESLLHGLCESATLTPGQAADVARRALEVQREYAEHDAVTNGPMRRAHALLEAIAASLDLNEGGAGG